MQNRRPQPRLCQKQLIWQQIYALFGERIRFLSCKLHTWNSCSACYSSLWPCWRWKPWSHCLASHVRQVALVFVGEPLHWSIRNLKRTRSFETDNAYWLSVFGAKELPPSMVASYVYLEDLLLAWWSCENSKQFKIMRNVSMVVETVSTPCIRHRSLLQDHRRHRYISMDAIHRAQDFVSWDSTRLHLSHGHVRCVCALHAVSIVALSKRSSFNTAGQGALRDWSQSRFDRRLVRTLDARLWLVIIVTMQWAILR